MAAPSYARSTTSSTSKASPGKLPRTPTKDSLPPETRSRKLKRPSLLTPEARQHISYSRDLYPIKPKDASQPSPLANLPSEIRSLIYNFCLPDTLYFSASRRPIMLGYNHPPVLLQICQAIRIEAGYAYYTRTAFTFTIRNLNFDHVKRWIDALPKEHRALLSKNRKLEINIIPRVANTFTYPPKGWLVDGWLQDHWKTCDTFGNIYTIQGHHHKKHFLIFCRLVSWWMWCSKPRNIHIAWTHNFDPSAIQNAYSASSPGPKTLVDFLRECVMVVTKPCVNEAWRRRAGVGKATGREAVRWLESLDDWYKENYQRTEEDEKDWDGKIRLVRTAMERW